VVLEAGHAGERTQHGEQRGDFRRHRSGVSGVRRRGESGARRRGERVSWGTGENAQG
jgi:hypothetical protein